ncbi:MAG: ECF transporter S component [Clostridia bacterium]|nr:ECF transporter S component [Clostridia bacterium]
MNTKKIVLNGLLCASGVLLPQAFHVFGMTSGMIFLPMHIPAIISGYILGPLCGLICGMVSPIISCFAVSMPTLAKMPFMAFEIGAYGFFSGLFFKIFSQKSKNTLLSVYVTLVLTQIAGRIVNLILLLAAVYLLKINTVSVASAWTAVVTGIPGIIIQWVFIPPLVMIIRKSSTVKNLNEKF